MKTQKINGFKVAVYLNEGFDFVICFIGASAGCNDKKVLELAKKFD